MKPVALVQHDKTQRAGVLLHYLQEIGARSLILCPEEGTEFRATRTKAASGPAVQREEQILLQLDRHLPHLHQISRRVYTHWASQLKRPPAVHCHARSGAPA